MPLERLRPGGWFPFEDAKHRAFEQRLKDEVEYTEWKKSQQTVESKTAASPTYGELANKATHIIGVRITVEQVKNASRVNGKLPKQKLSIDKLVARLKKARTVLRALRDKSSTLGKK